MLALLHCSSSESQNFSLQLVTAYRALAVPLVAHAFASIASQSAESSQAEWSIRLVLSLAEAAHLLPQICPLLAERAAQLPALPRWLAAGGSRTSCIARQLLLLLLALPQLLEVWSPAAFLQLMVHETAAVRWLGIQASAQRFAMPASQTSQLEQSLFADQELAQCVLEWEQHCQIIQVCSILRLNHCRKPHLAGAVMACSACIIHANTEAVLATRSPVKRTSLARAH